MEKRVLILFLLLISSSTLASCCKTPALFTFGDSIFDARNNQFNKNCSVQANFYPYGSTFFHHPTGRFTNGKTIVDFISGIMGIGFQKPYLEVKMNARRRGFPSNGINFASGGSGLLRDTNQIMRKTSASVNDRKISSKAVKFEKDAIKVCKDCLAENADFHPCINDSVIIEFQSQAGPITRPVKKTESG